MQSQSSVVPFVELSGVLHSDVSNGNVRHEHDGDGYDVRCEDDEQSEVPAVEYENRADQPHDVQPCYEYCRHCSTVRGVPKDNIRKIIMHHMIDACQNKWYKNYLKSL